MNLIRGEPELMFHSLNDASNDSMPTNEGKFGTQIALFHCVY